LAVDTLPLSSFFSVEEKVNKKEGRKDLPALSIQRPPAHSLYIVNISPFTVRSITHPPPPPPPPGKNKYLKRKTGFLHSSVPWFILQLRFETKQKVQCFEQVRIFRRDLLSLLKNSFYSTILAQKNIISISV
jgi:hypothetical protein